MRLNMDCVRDILLCIEANTGLRKSCIFQDAGLYDAHNFLGNSVSIQLYQDQLLQKYENDMLIYHLRYCIDADLICADESSPVCDYVISDLTPSGHELIANIRNNSNWASTKDIGSKVGAFGLNMVAKIAESVATSLIAKYLPLF